MATPGQRPAGPDERPAGRDEQGAPVRRPATDAEAKALASVLRLQILRLTLDEALTNKEIAERVDRNPASVLHHVRTLVDTGFLHPDAVRRGTRGSREVPYRATGKSWYLEAPARDSAILDAFVTEVGQVPAEDLAMTRLGLRLSTDDMTEFRRRLYDLLEEFHDRPRDPDAEPWSLFLALHPDVGRRR